MIPLGPFALLEPVGRGGMSEVWRGVHREQDVPVAVKVLTAEGARVDRYLAALRNEVRSVAGLDHEHIVTIFEHGEIGEETASASDERLVAGSPYLAMEWASGGTLGSAPLPHGWTELRETLLALLSALAHAHARRVVHRDLKLSNILRCLEEDQRPGLKLADFGIARPRTLEEERGVVGGTVGYMAPEQLLGRWHDQGPWTDLYALGCIAYKLATGAAVFGRGAAEEIAHAHLFLAVPRMKPRFPVPEGFQEWIEALLEKEPEDRVPLAADAALLLRGLGDAPASVRPRVRRRRAKTESTEPATVAIGGADAPTVEEVTSSSSGGRASSIPAPNAVVVPGLGVVDERRVIARALGRPVPPVPDTWRTAEDPDVRGAALPGTGLGLYGLRTLGLVDREDERSRLWDELRQVATQRRARAVVLEGPAGYGKSRLAQWLCDRALELGAAQVLEATHGAMGGPTDGLGPMLAGVLRCTGLPHRLAAPQVLRVLRSFGERDVDEWAALTELVAPAEPGDGHDSAEPVVRFRSARERHEVARRHLVRVAAARPLILWIDDAQWGHDALSFLAHLLDTQERAPCAVLVLATVRVEALVDRPAERALVEGLVARTEVHRMMVGRLPESHWPALVRALLGLEGGLAAEVETRTAGNPMFAVQLVGDWVQRGVLEPTAEGFRLREGARPEVPADVQTVWDARVRELLAHHAEEAGCAIELAAALGREVDVDEWSDACTRSGLELPWALVEEMLDARLAHAGHRGPRVSFAFVHAMLQASLERRASDAGRARAHHRACAATLAARQGLTIAERVAHHLIAAGDDEAALGPLMDAVRARSVAGDYSLALELVATREAALQRVGATASDARVCDGIAERARIEVLAGQLDQAMERAALAEGVARIHEWQPIVARALCTRARGAQRQGRLADGEAMCAEGLAIARALEDREVQADALYTLGIIQFERGRSEDALATQEEARALFEELGRSADVTQCLYERALIERRLGRTDDALITTRLVLERTAAEGGRAVQANAYTSLGEIAREKGDLEQAERDYDRALVLCEAIGTPNAMVARMNVALVRMVREHWLEARELLRPVRDDLDRAGWKGLLLCARVELMACDAALGDFEAWDAEAAGAATLVPDWDGTDPDLAWAATRAAELACAAGEIERARLAWEIARREWAVLGNAEETRKAEEALGREPSG